MATHNLDHGVASPESQSDAFDADLFDRWIDALNAGVYQQGRDRLRPTTDSYCCLGVACDLYDPTGWHKDDLGLYDNRGHTTIPSSELHDRLGLTAEEALVLARLNDYHEFTFPMIADVVTTMRARLRRVSFKTDSGDDLLCNLYGWAHCPDAHLKGVTA